MSLDFRPLPEDVRTHTLGRFHDHGDGRLCAYHHRLGVWTFDGLNECLRDHSDLSPPEPSAAPSRRG